MVVTHKIARISDLRGWYTMAESTCGPEAWRERALWRTMHWFRFPTLSLGAGSRSGPKSTGTRRWALFSSSLIIVGVSRKSVGITERIRVRGSTSVARLRANHRGHRVKKRAQRILSRLSRLFFPLFSGNAHRDHEATADLSQRTSLAEGDFAFRLRVDE